MQDETNKDFEEILELLRGLQSLNDEAYALYKPMVIQLCKRNATEAEVVDVLEGLLNFCMDERFVLLYRTVCHRYYPKYTQMICEYVRLYFDLYPNEETDEEDEDA